MRRVTGRSRDPGGRKGRRPVEVPEVPVVVPDTDAAKAAPAQPQAAADANVLDDSIRRMLEAAYT